MQRPDGTPIAKVNLRAAAYGQHGGGGFQSETDERGDFDFPLPIGGAYDLGVAVDEFVFEPVHNMPLQGTVAAPFVFIGRPAIHGVVEGKVTLPDGKPAVGVAVKLYARPAIKLDFSAVAIGREVENWSACGANPTDEKGAFRFEVIQGEYAVEVTLASRSLWRGSRVRQQVLTAWDMFDYRQPLPQYCGVCPGWKEGLRVENESPVRADVSLSAGGTVKGIVVDDAGKPVANATLLIADGNPKLQLAPFQKRKAATSDERGRFEIHGLHVGPYLLSIDGGEVELRNATLIHARAPSSDTELRIVVGRR